MSGSSTPPDPPPDDSSPREGIDFLQVVKVSGGVSLAAMAAFLLSIKQVNPKLEFQFAWWTLLGAVAAGWAGWKMLDKTLTPESGGRRSARFWFLLMSGILVAVTLAAFGHGLKDVRNEALFDVLVGTTVALVFLTLIGIFVWRIIQFLESQDRISEEIREKETPPEDKPEDFG